MNLRTCLSLLNRRQWLKVFLLGSAASTAFAGKRKPIAGLAPTAAPAPRPIVASLTPSSHNSAIIPVRISEFPELAQSGGSLALYFSNVQYPIVINRADGDVFHALDPTCTHQGCLVGNYNTETSHMECDCHGSLFSIDGRVAAGPAQFDLTSFPVSFDGNDLVEVELGELPLRIDRVSVHSTTPTQTRLRLEFPGITGCKYKVRYYASLAGAPQPAPFSFSASGAADQSAFTVPQYTPSNPLSGDGPKSVWVDAPGAEGFFAIEMVLGTSTPL
ncbi:MAG: Rieske (2Fe-2S) protein [Chthoniobacteraceae bacterium]